MEKDLILLFEAINSKYDYDFRHYSKASMKRMVVRGMNRMECPTLVELKDKVMKDVESFYVLLQSLTVPVSEMFRDPSFFLALRNEVFPHLKTYPSLKIWVAGCSTGEEVVSLAILLQEEGLLDRTTLYATDINPRVIEKAETGLFDLHEITKFSKNYNNSGGKMALSDYFTPQGAFAMFDPNLMKNVTFADHSLATDAVFSEMQLILCRNVLIYFDRELQAKAITLFYESLCRNGFLGLGSAETIQFLQQEKYFQPFVKGERIFQRK